MGLMKSGKVKDLQTSSDDVRRIVEETLKETPDTWYTTMGMMVLKFGVKEDDILGIAWKDMKNEHARLYNRVKRAFKGLVESKKVAERKHEKAMVYYWIAKP
jgi:predicted oxidoreductase (fatty acid repression mutant protein)